MTALADRLDQIEARAAAATEGPWGWHGYMETGATLATPGLVIGGFPTHELNVLKTTDDWAPTTADATFIAAARTDVPALTKALRAVLDEHRSVPIYLLSDECGHKDDDHDVMESDTGDTLCLLSPTGDLQCETCRDDDGEHDSWPCATVRAITAALAGA